MAENRIEVNNKVFEIFLEEETIQKRIRLMAIQLNLDFEDKCPMFIGVLNGSFLFLADLVKEMDITCEVNFIKVASYHGDESTGEVKELLAFSDVVKNRDVIIVEDIIDSGLTLKYILDALWTKQPASVSVCSLLYKPKAVQHQFKELKYVGFEIPNEFVVGYGLDYDGLGRNLKAIYRAV